MTDFRQQFYARYVSTFKGLESPSDEQLRAFREWARHKWLPLLTHVDKRGAILDLGCGSGNYLDFLGREGFARATGVDVSAEQVRLARDKGVSAVEGDLLAHLEAHPHEYDVIFAIDVIEHFAKDELLRLTAAIHDALRPGGTLLVHTPNGAGLLPGSVIYGDLTHMTIFNEGSLVQLLRISGFEAIECFEAGPAPRNLAGRVRLLLWSLIRATAALCRKVESGESHRIWTQTVICRCRRP